MNVLRILTVAYLALILGALPLTAEFESPSTEAIQQAATSPSKLPALLNEASVEQVAETGSRVLAVVATMDLSDTERAEQAALVTAYCFRMVRRDAAVDLSERLGAGVPESLLEPVSAAAMIASGPARVASKDAFAAATAITDGDERVEAVGTDPVPVLGEALAARVRRIALLPVIAGAKSSGRLMTALPLAPTPKIRPDGGDLPAEPAPPVARRYRGQ